MNVILGLRILLAMSALLGGVKGAALLGLLPDWPPSASAAASQPAAMPAATPAPEPAPLAAPRAEAAPRLLRVASAGLNPARAAPPPPEPVAQAAAPPALPSALEAPRWLAASPARPQPVTPPVGQAAPAETSGLEDGLAQALRSRREALDERERLLAMREAVVAAAEQRLQARLDQLAGLQARLEENERQIRQRDDAHWASLARLYETMRPREAALVFNELDLPLLAQIVNRMREQKAAPVFGAMEPERVRALTAELARMRAARPGL